MEQLGQFTFYRSYFDTIMVLKTHKQRSVAFELLCRYILDGTEPEDVTDVPVFALMAFNTTKPHLTSSRRKAIGAMSKGKQRSTPPSPPPSPAPSSGKGSDQDLMRIWEAKRQDMACK